VRAPLKRLLIRLLERKGYCVIFGEPATFTGIVSSLSRRTRNFFFIQIGAYDGRKDDPIYELVQRNRWSGILVEPQPDIFERLKQNYASFSGLAFEQAAIVEEGTSFSLYKLKGRVCAPVPHGSQNFVLLQAGADYQTPFTTGGC
jgi:hypothetical protein